MHNNNYIMLNKVTVDYICISLQTAYLAPLLQESGSTSHADKHIWGVIKSALRWLLQAFLTTFLSKEVAVRSVGPVAAYPAPSTVSYKVICSVSYVP